MYKDDKINQNENRYKLARDYRHENVEVLKTSNTQKALPTSQTPPEFYPFVGDVGPGIFDKIPPVLQHSCS